MEAVKEQSEEAKRKSIDKYAFIQKLNRVRAGVQSSVLVDNRTAGSAPDVSVIVPVWNVAPFLRECLDSLKRQTLPNIEIICVDDGSTDNSLDILKEYAARDSRFIIITQENAGQSVARNTGVRHAKGKYLYFCDSDDFLKDNALEKMTALCEKENLDMLFFNTDILFESNQLEQKYAYMKVAYKRTSAYEGIQTGKDLMKQMLENKEYMVPPWSSLIKRQFFLECSLWFTPGIIHEDDIYMFKAMYYAGRCAYLEDKLYVRRVRDDSTMTMKKTFAHTYGYFYCILQLLEMLQKENVPKDDEELIKQIILPWQNEYSRIYFSLPKEDQDFIDVLPLYEQIQFKALSSHKSPDAQIQKQLYNIRHSKSFRIGLMITFIPRKARLAVRCFKKFGLRYTIQRVLYHLKICK